MKTKSKILIFLLALLLARTGICGLSGSGVGAVPSLVGNGVAVQQAAHQHQLDQQQAAQLAAAEQQREFDDYIKIFIPLDPWRVINGETNYVKIKGVQFSGKILQVQSHGVLIEGGFGSLYDQSLEADREFFVTNFPFAAADGETIDLNEHLMAWSVGTVTFTTVGGSSRTIRELDYGSPCPTPKLTPEQIAAAKKAAEDAKAKAEAAKKLVADNILKANQDAAANGDAYGLLRMGERYRDGDGVEKDLAKAKVYFQKATDAGSTTAAEELSALKQ